MSSTEQATGSDEAYEHISTPTVTIPHSLLHAVYKRRAEYTRPHTIRVKIGSWNVAGSPDIENDIGGWFVEGKGIDKKLAGLEISEDTAGELLGATTEDVKEQGARRSKEKSALPLNDQNTTVSGGDHIDLYVLGLQEMVELTSAKEYLTRVYVDPVPALKWKKAVASALPDGYELVSEQQLSGLFLLIYASPKVASTISSVSSVSVGTGFLGYLGNKGAVVTRIVLGETTRMVFVNCHLASGTDAADLSRRCWDVSQILTRTRFEPISRAGVLDDVGEGIGDGDFEFWFGDLNFRLEGLPGEDIRRLLMLHTKGEYRIGSRTQQKIDKELGENDDPIIIHHVDSDDDSTVPSTPPNTNSNGDQSGDNQWSALPDPDDFVQDPHSDPESLQAIIDSLLPHDQLKYVQEKRQAFYEGWREGPITFLPTYKYDIGRIGLFDSSEKKRSPSWCDRILFRTRRDKLEYDIKSQEEELARLKDEDMKARGIHHAADDDEILFDYDPESDGVDFDGDGEYDENEDGIIHPQPAVTREGYVDNLRLEVYTSHQGVFSSDHKPLDAVFTVVYDAVVPGLKSKIQQEVARELDREENEGRPSITVVIDHSHEIDDVTLPESAERPVTSTVETPSLENIEGVDFGEVRYLCRKSRRLTIANTGRVPATFSFVKRPVSPGESERIAPEWMGVDFAGSDVNNEHRRSGGDLATDVTLVPGNVINVTLEVYVVNIAHVRALNEGNLQLDDVLVLRVTDGRDHFIPIRGTWMQSCFGRSIDELIRVPKGGVRALVPRRRDSDGKLVNREQNVCWSAPRELFKLTEAIESLTERSLADRDMIESATVPMNSTGWPFDQSSWMLTDRRVREVRRCHLLEALDSDKNLIGSFPPEMPAMEKLEIVSEVLLLFLGSMSDGIITGPLWDRLEHDILARKQTLSPGEERSWVLDVLSSAPNHNISFVFLTSMLSRAAAELAPLPLSSSTTAAGSAKSSIGHRRSLSFRGRSPPVNHDPAISRRQAMARQWAEIFTAVVFRGSATPGGRERKASDGRQRELMEVFLQGDVERNSR